MMIVSPLSVCRVSAPDQTVGRVRFINEIYYYYYYYSFVGSISVFSE